jgi:plasmid maintenance system antidote protein VapI
MKLETSYELLERLRAKYSSSWYGLADVLGAHEKTIANWKNRRTVVDKRFAPRLAALLDEAPEYVLACLEAEREPDAEVRKLWERIATKFRSHAASILLVGFALFGVGSATKAEAFDTHAGSDVRANVYYGKRRTRRFLSLIPA